MAATFLRAMTPALAQLTPEQFHAQGARWERIREAWFLARGDTFRASTADLHARRHERELVPIP